MADAITARGGRAVFRAGDAASPDDVAGAVRAAVRLGGQLDLLWANAGIGVARTVPETTLEEWDRVLAVNLTGAFLLAKYGIPELAAAGGGTMVITGSANSFTADRSWAAYCASKGGLLMLCRALALDHAAEGIRVNIVCPGSVSTPMHDDWLAGHAGGRTLAAGPGGGPGRAPAGPGRRPGRGGPGRPVPVLRRVELHHRDAAAGGRGRDRVTGAVRQADYSIWVVEFARATSPLGLLLHGQAGEREIPYSFTVLRSAEHTILVDAGYADTGRGRELAAEDGITVWRDPAALLARTGLSPGDVDAILVTHAHFDHLGNLAAFPNATVYIQRREVEKWAWAVSLPRRMDWLKQGVSTDDLAGLMHLAGRAGCGWWTARRRTCSPGSAWSPTSTRTPTAISTW